MPSDAKLQSLTYKRNVGVHLCMRPQGGHAGSPLQKLSIEKGFPKVLKSVGRVSRAIFGA